MLAWSWGGTQVNLPVRPLAAPSSLSLWFAVGVALWGHGTVGGGREGDGLQKDAVGHGRPQGSLLSPP